MTLKYSKKNNGFTLFIAIVVTSMFTLISFVVINISLKQIILANAGQQSQVAFYAAESGVECAIYWDLTDVTSEFDINTPGTITCYNQTIGVDHPQVLPTGIPALIGGGVGDRTSKFYITLPRGCAVVYVTKNANNTTTIDSRGYNTCDVNALRRFERGVTITYQ